MFLEHVDNVGKFLKFFVKKKKRKKIPLLKKGARTLFFCRFLKNAVPCRFSLLKFYNFYIFYLIDSQVMTKTIFTKSYHGTKYKGGTSLKSQISQKKFYILVYAPRQQKFFRCPGKYMSVCNFIEPN